MRLRDFSVALLSLRAMRFEATLNLDLVCHVDVLEVVVTEGYILHHPVRWRLSTNHRRARQDALGR